MPYATISDSTIKVMVTSWTALQTEIAAMKKDKKADKKKIAELEKRLGEKGQAIVKKSVEDITLARKSFVEHSMKVDNWLGDCNHALAASKEAAKRMEATNSTKDMDEAGSAETKIAEIAKAAKTDNDELGASWFGYRGGVVDSVDKKYGDPMKAVRNEIIAAEKILKSKLVQMETLVGQATAVKESAKRLLIGGLNFVEENHAEAAKIETDMKNQHVIVLRNAQQVIDKSGSMGRAVDAAKAGDKKAVLGTLAMAQTLCKEAIKQLNDAKLGATGMSKSLATQMKSFSPEDLKDTVVKTHLDSAQRLVNEAVEKVKLALPTLKVLEAGLKEIETIAKNKK